jgi:hypothetical protein
MAIPRVFISYSHDTQEHKKWVLDLATRLRNTGIDAALDQWDLQPGDDLPAFMEKNLRESDRVLMICTAKYVEKANAGHGGVGYEKMIITSELLDSIDSNKVIPLIRQSGSQHVPTFLKSKLYINFSRHDDYEFAFDELVRTIHGAPLYVKPEIGNNPFQKVSEVPPQKTGEPLLQLMQAVVTDYEQGQDYTVYRELVQRIPASRIMFDLMIDDAVAQDLVVRDRDGDLVITARGKHFAIEHGQIRR